MGVALTRVFPVLALVIKQVFEVLHPGIVELAGLFNQPQIDSRHVFSLFAEVVCNHPLIPAKGFNCQIVLSPHPCRAGDHYFLTKSISCCWRTPPPPPPPPPPLQFHLLGCPGPSNFFLFALSLTPL